MTGDAPRVRVRERRARSVSLPVAGLVARLARAPGAVCSEAATKSFTSTALRLQSTPRTGELTACD